MKDKKISTIFQLPAIEERDKFIEIKNHVYNIIESPKFIEFTTKVKIPVGATRQDVNKLLKDNAPEKIKQAFEILFEDNFEDIMHILAIIFCQDYNLYITKSFDQIIQDLQALSQQQIGMVVGFFTHAGR